MPTVVEDLAKGKAYIDLSLEAKFAILKKAGCPWVEHEECWLTPLQQEILSRQEKIVILHGGGGSGKSLTGGAAALCELMIPGSKTCIVGPTKDLATKEFDYAYKGFLKLFSPSHALELHNKITPVYHNQLIRTVWGSSLRCYTVHDNEGISLLGEEFDLMILAEGSRIEDSVWQTVLRARIDRRTRSHRNIRNTGRALILTTPNEYEGVSAFIWEQVMRITNNQPEKMHVGNVPWAETIYLRQARKEEDPNYDPSIWAAAETTLSREAYLEQYEGKMIRRSGLVYPEFNRAKNLIELPTPEAIRNMRLAIGMDPGMRGFGVVLLGLDRKKIGYVLNEVFAGEGTNFQDTMEQIKLMVVDALQPVYGEDWNLLKDRIPTWYIDPSSPQKDNVEESLGIVVLYTGDNTKGTWEPGTNAIRERFAENTLRLVEDTTPNLQNEYAHFRWPPLRDARQSGDHRKAKGKDHLIDAVRYGFLPLVVDGPLEEIPEAKDPKTQYENNMRDSMFREMKSIMSGAAGGTTIPAMFRNLRRS